MATVIVDYKSGNLHSAAKSFQRVAGTKTNIQVSSDPKDIAAADRIVLPGVGAFADCAEGLRSFDGLFDAIERAVFERAVPFLGICVGMQMMTSVGREHGIATKGFDWISGAVEAITPDDPSLKVPHMGWNSLEIGTGHAVLEGIPPGDHAYFVHSYHVVTKDPAHVLATTDHGGAITAVIGKDNMVGTQFHPEKSQKTGLRLIENFLNWSV